MTEEDNRQKWIPIESNPELMNKFLWNVGVPKEWQIVDVIGLDEELLPFIGGPVLSLILLFPGNVAPDSTESDENQITEEDLKNVWVIRQTIRNACGTIAMIHSVANNCDKIQFKADSCLKKFLDSSQDLSPEERGKLLESNADISTAHYNSAKEGQTSATPDTNTTNHYVALIHKNGVLYEMNGTKPLKRGKTSEETFLSDAARVCRQYMDRDTDNLKFSVLALCYQN